MSKKLLYIDRITGERLSKDKLTFTQSGLITFLKDSNSFGEVSRSAWESSYLSKYGKRQDEKKQNNLSRFTSSLLKKRMRSWPYFSHLFRFASTLNVGTPILEVGCGTAKTSLWLAREFGLVPYGIDFSEAAILEASCGFLENGLDPLNLSVTDVTALPFDNDTFPLVFGKTVFEHFDYPDIAVREIFRVTSKDGCVVMDVPNSRNSFLRGATLRYLNQPYTTNTYTIEEFRSFFENDNFEILETWGSWIIYTTPAILLNELFRFLKKSKQTTKSISTTDDNNLSFTKSIGSRDIRYRILIFPLVLVDKIFKMVLRFFNEFCDRIGLVTETNGRLIGLVAKKSSNNLIG